MRLLAPAVGFLSVPLVLAALLHLAGGVEAGTALRMDVPALVERAELVLEARVLSAKALELPDGRIETELLLDVDRTFVGPDLPLRAVRVPGGVLPGGRGMLLAGMPRLAVGETALLFLSAASEGGVRMPVGLAQGKLRVVRGAGGEKALVREQAGLSLVHPDTGAVVDAPGLQVLSYAEVVAQIEAARAARAAAGSGR